MEDVLIKRYSSASKIRNSKDIGCFGSSRGSLPKSEDFLQDYAALRKIQLGKYEKNVSFLKCLLRWFLWMIAGSFALWFLFETAKNINFFDR